MWHGPWSGRSTWDGTESTNRSAREVSCAHPKGCPRIRPGEDVTQRIRLDPDRPSPTVIAGGIRPQFLFAHPFQNRGLTVRERAQLQSFPDTFVFEGGMAQGRVLTGNAVPPLLAEALAGAIKRALDNDSPGCGRGDRAERTTKRAWQPPLF